MFVVCCLFVCLFVDAFQSQIGVQYFILKSSSVLFMVYLYSCKVKCQVFPVFQSKINVSFKIKFKLLNDNRLHPYSTWRVVSRVSVLVDRIKLKRSQHVYTQSGLEKEKQTCLANIIPFFNQCVNWSKLLVNLTCVKIENDALVNF